MKCVRPWKANGRSIAIGGLIIPSRLSGSLFTEAPFGRGFSLRFDNGASEQGPILPRWHYIMTKEIGTEAALENCRALINQIDAGLSAEEPFINVSSAAELLFYLEFAASALQRDATNSGPHPR